MDAKQTVGPALEALEALQDDVLSRVGKPDGNLNGKLKAQFRTLKQMLYDLDTIESMNKTINQQSQLMAKVINDSARLRETLLQILKQQQGKVPAGLAGGEDVDDSDDTKGE